MKATEKSTLEKIYGKLESIEERLQELTERLETRRISFNERQTLIRIPYPAIKTYLTNETNGDYTATDIAERTGRHRAVESAIL